MTPRSRTKKCKNLSRALKLKNSDILFINDCQNLGLHELKYDEDQPNTKLNHAKNPLGVPNGSITRAMTNKLKEALNGLVQNIWSKMDLEVLGMPREHEGQPLIHLIQVQEELNSRGSKG